METPAPANPPIVSRPSDAQIAAMTRALGRLATRARFKLRRINRSPEDAVQDVLLECCRCWSRYDPARSKPATWAKKIGRRRLRDMLRDGTRKRRYLPREMMIELDSDDLTDDVVDRLTAELTEEMDEGIEETVMVPDEVLAEQIMAAGAKFRRLKGDLNPASVPPLSRAAVCVLMARTMLGSRAMALYLRSRPDLLRILNLRKAPSHMTIHRWVVRSMLYRGIHTTVTHERKNRRNCREVVTI